MDDFNAAYKDEQNKIAASGAWIWLVEIFTAGYTPNPTLRFTNNNAKSAPNQYSTTWPTAGGSQYWSVPLTIDDIKESTSGEFPEYKIKMDEVDLSSDLRKRIIATGGLVGSTMRLMVVHSDHLDLTTPAIDELAEILNCELTAGSVVFTIGIPSLLSRRFPRDRYVPGFCRHKFAGGLCQYVLPGHSLTSTQIAFIEGVEGVAGVRYDRIQVNSGLVVTSLFVFAPGRWQYPNYILTKDTAFTVSGSVSNDGYFLANSYQPVGEDSIRTVVEEDGARPFVAESAGASITIQLGYSMCDHTLEACKNRDNTQNFGGSPGIVGGMYG